MGIQALPIIKQNSTRAYPCAVCYLFYCVSDYPVVLFQKLFRCLRITILDRRYNAYNSASQLDVARLQVYHHILVNLSGLLDRMLLQTTRLHTVMSLADRIYLGIRYGLNLFAEQSSSANRRRTSLSTLQTSRSYV